MNTHDQKSITVIRQRIQALKHMLCKKNLEVQLGKAMQSRYCKRVPLDVAIWFVVGVGMFSADAYRQIFRWLAPLGTEIPGSTRPMN